MVFPQCVQDARCELVLVDVWGGIGWYGGLNLLQLANGNVSPETVLSHMIASLYTLQEVRYPQSQTKHKNNHAIYSFLLVSMNDSREQMWCTLIRFKVQFQKAQASVRGDASRAAAQKAGRRRRSSTCV